MSNTKTFPGFEFPANLIRRYACAIGIFTMLLSDGTIINYEPNDADAFKRWLNENHVADMQADH